MDYNNKIEQQIHRILNHKFPNNFNKQEVVPVSTTSLRFACPYCGDSKRNDSLKRGNYYFDSGFFHCFNCSRHLSGVKLLNYFNDNEDYEIINHIKKLNIRKNLTTLNINFDVHKLLEYGIDKDLFFEKLNLTPLTPQHPFIKKRVMKHVVSNFAERGNYIYIFNIINDKIIGYQLRHKFKKLYIKFPLSKIYETCTWLDTPDFDLTIFNKISLVYNLLNIDTSVPFTIFEGPIDCWSYMKNAIGMSSITVNTDFLDNTGNAQYMYDNSIDGRIKMIDKLNKGCGIFLWKKFIKDFNISVHLNDMNDILKYFELNNISPNELLTLDKYFTKNKFNLAYV